MEILVCSRTKMEDYVWRAPAGRSFCSPPVSIETGFNQWKFEDGIPWYGLVSSPAIGETTLYLGNLVTNREDSRGRPIFVHAALWSENGEDVRTLRRIVSSLLVQEKDLISKWTTYLLGIFDGETEGTFPSPLFASDRCVAKKDIGQFEYPREDLQSRQSVAEWLCSEIKSDCQFAVGTTGRSGKGIFERVCRSHGDWQVAFFSSLCSIKSKLVSADPLPAYSEGVLNTRVRAAAIEGAVILAILVAAIGSCSRGCGKGSDKGATSAVFSTGGAGTNAAPSRGIVEAND